MVQETFLPHVGGAELHVLRIAQALQARGHAVSVVTACPGPRVCEGVPVIRLPFLEGRGRRSFVTVPFGYLMMLPHVLRADVVHGHYSARMSAMAGRLCNVLRRPFVLTLHGYGTLDSSVRDDARMLRDRRTSMRLARYVIGTSQEMCQIAEGFVESRKVKYIPSGVDCAIFARGDGGPTGQMRIATIRRLVPKNGVQFVLEALPRIQALTGRMVSLTVVGDGRLRVALERRAAELGLSDSVEFLGMVDNHDLPPILKGTDVVVFASSAEATSLAALEAMASGKPIVATPVGSYPELIGDDERGVLVDLFGQDASDYQPPQELTEAALDRLSAAVASILLDPERAQSIGRAAAEWVASRYDWSTIAERVEELYSDQPSA